MIIEENISGAGVYKISHPDTNKIYVGSAEDMLNRAGTHEWMINTNVHHSRNLKLFATKVNKSLFKFSILERVSDIFYLEKREQYYLDTLLHANENNADFFKLGLNGGRIAKRNCGNNCEKPILQYSLNGNFIREWRSALVASKEINISYTSIIQASLGTLKNFNSAGGFQWKAYEENYPFSIKKFENPFFVKILMYNMEGKFIREFVCLRQAGIITGIPPGMINKSCKNKTICRSYRFTFFVENYPLDIGQFKYYLSKHIHCYEKKTGNLIGIFDSFEQCHRVISVASVTVSRLLNKIGEICKYVFYTEELPNEFFNQFKKQKI